MLGREADSPRGRIYQILQADAGRLQISDFMVTHLDRCLGCLACQTACPSGVQYGRILERARAEIQKNYRRPWLARRVRDYFFLDLLHNARRLSRASQVLRFYQRSGLQSFVRASGLLKLLRLDKLEGLCPPIDDLSFFRQLGRYYGAEGEQRGTVAFLVGCVASVAFSDLNWATLRVLNKNGISVYIPGRQRCCGALHAHAGYLDEARHLARKNIRAFEDPSFEAVVTNAAGCGAMMKEYAELLADDPEYAQPAREFIGRVKDVTEYLAEIGLRPPSRALNLRVTYQDPCHLAHAQKIRSAPRELLKAVGCELNEMPHADQCCGSAGTYNVMQNELSMKILDEKMDEVTATPAEVVATANVGCMLQLRAGIQARGLDTRVAHVIELLDAAYE